MLKSFKILAKNVFLRTKYRNYHVQIQEGCDININSFFEGNNVIGSYSSFHGSVGFGTYMGSKCTIDAVVGRYCSIGSNVVTIRGLHPSSKFVSTHPAFFSTYKQAGFSYVDRILFNEFKYADNSDHLVEIGNDVWIGSNSILMPGVHIGNGAIIGAGAIVTHDVSPYSIVVGVPAREIRKRFSDTEIECLLESEWWNKSEEWIKENIIYFSDVQNFVDAFREGVLS